MNIVVHNLRSRSWRFRLAAGLAGSIGLALTAGGPLAGAPQAAPSVSAPRVITVHPASPQQTMRGWEVLADANQNRPDYGTFQTGVLDKVVEAGINRARLEVRAGVENPVDAFANWRAAGFPQGTQYPDYVTWRASRYETINDDSDPNLVNPAGFHFTEVDSVVKAVINPLRARLAARGEALYVNLDYVVGLPQVTSGAYYVHQSPAEYAEFALAAFQHLQQQFGWVPDAMEMVLEPDNNLPIWTPALVGQVIAATGARLSAAGFHPDIIAPSTVCMSAAVDYFDGIVAVPGALPYLKELSYHRYCNADLAHAQTIAARAASVGIATSMLEWWDPRNTFETLHEDLKFGRNGAWEQGAIVNLQADHTVGTIAYVNLQTPTVAAFTNPTQFFRRYFEHVRIGAVRVDASSSSAETDPLAFRNTNGAFTVVVKATAAGPIALNGLPAGTYGIDYTASQFARADEPNLIGRQPDQTIAAGQTLTTDIPAWGVITIYGQAAGGSSREMCGDLKDNNGNGQIDEGCPSVNPNTAPGVPLQFTAQVTGGTLALQWRAPIAGGRVQGYVLDAGVTPGSTLVSLPIGAGTSALLPGVPPGRYLLRVRAVGPGGTSAPSNEAAITAGGCASVSRAPRGLAALTNGPFLSLAWQDDDGCEGRRFKLLVGSKSGAADLGAVPLLYPGFVGSAPPGEYFLRLVTETSRGVSATSNEVVARPRGVCQPPAFPVAVRGAMQGGVLDLAWSPVDVAAAEAADAVTPLSYVIEAGSSAGRSDLGVYPVGRTTVLAGPVPAGSLFLRLRATSACGPGPASNTLPVSVP